jgi:hypothetical protein
MPHAPVTHEMTAKRQPDTTLWPRTTAGDRMSAAIAILTQIHGPAGARLLHHDL